MFGQKSLDLASGAATQAENVCHPPQVRHPQAFFDESGDEVAYSIPHGEGGRLMTVPGLPAPPGTAKASTPPRNSAGPLPPVYTWSKPCGSAASDPGKP